MKDDILKEIISHKYKEIKNKKERLPLTRLCQMACATPASGNKMSKQIQKSETGIISEFKRRSPSKGWINRSADPAKIIPGYEAVGATAISVLTDESFFGARENDFQQARSQTRLPILRKEFIIDEYQLFESRLLGADAVLLIAAALDLENCKKLVSRAIDLNLEVLLEIHEEKELDYISPDISMIGINNRNLGSFQTCVDHSFRLGERLPKEAIKISESGISSPQTVYELRRAGFQGFLIGETFMRTEYPEQTLRHFLSELTLLQKTNAYDSESH